MKQTDSAPNNDSTMKATPGPWRAFHQFTHLFPHHEHIRITTNEADEWGEEISDTGKTIAELPKIDGPIGEKGMSEEQAANGNLIAAAPDLYETLETVDALIGLTLERQWPALHEMIQAALKKAGKP